MRTDAHAAGAAFFVANFGERDAIVLFGDAIVVIEQIFRNFRDDAARSAVSSARAFPPRAFSASIFDALGAHDFFHFLQQLFRSS